MTFTEENKRTILALLKSNQQQAAQQYIAGHFGVSKEDSVRLLAVFESQFMGGIATPMPPSKSINLSGCVGCFHGLLKGISIFLVLIGFGVLAVGYFIPGNFFHFENDMLVPAKVKGLYFTSPDSTNVRLILSYSVNGQMGYDTTNSSYSTGLYYIGDSLHVTASNLNLEIDGAYSEGIDKIQKSIFLFGTGFLFFALIFWLVGIRLKSVVPNP